MSRAVSQASRFALWALVGAGACLAALSMLTIGIFIAPVVAVVALVLLVTTPPDRSLAGAISGLALPLFYVAWLNRDGPGVACHDEPGLTSCADRWSPWPWLVVGLVLLALGVLTFTRMGRREGLSEARG